MLDQVRFICQHLPEQVQDIHHRQPQVGELLQQGFAGLHQGAHVGAAGVAADEDQAPQALAVKFPAQVTEQGPQGVAADADGARVLPGGAADAVKDRRAPR